MARVKLGFSRFAVTVKIFKARYIISKMTGNPNFPTLPPEIDLPVLIAAVDALEQAALDAAKGGTDKTLIMHIREAELVYLMVMLQDLVQVASGGDPIKIESSGMEVRKEREPAVLLPAVQRPNAKVGGNPGEIIVSWAGMEGNKGYVVEMKLPTPVAAPNPVSGGSDEDIMAANTIEWIRIDTVTRLKLIVKGLETGRTYQFRIAAINSAGQGSYSQVVSSVAP